MKKYFNPITIIVALFVSALIISNINCKGHASTNDKNISDASDLPSTDKNTGSVITLTEKTFDENTTTGIVLVDFWATWCPPCRMMGPVIESVGKEMSGKANVFKLDIDQSPAIADRYNVQNIPTMIILKDGKEVERFVGITQKSDITSAIEKFTNSKK